MADRKHLALVRLVKDLQALEDDEPHGCSAGPIDRDADMFRWRALIVGPENSPWEGGLFKLSIVFPEDYPHSPPTVQFLSRVFHPNVYADGFICIDILKQKWTPVYTVSSILVSIQSLLADPNVDSPANADAAYLFNKDPTAFRGMVRRCVEASLHDC